MQSTLPRIARWLCQSHFDIQHGFQFLRFSVQRATYCEMFLPVSEFLLLSVFEKKFCQFIPKEVCQFLKDVSVRTQAEQKRQVQVRQTPPPRDSFCF